MRIFKWVRVTVPSQLSPAVYVVFSEFPPAALQLPDGDELAVNSYMAPVTSPPATRRLLTRLTFRFDDLFVYKPKFHVARQVTSRHDTLPKPMHFAIRKSRDETWRDVSRLSDSPTGRSSQEARLARHVFRGVATAWNGLNTHISFFSDAVPEIDANPEHKRLNLYTLALYYFFVVRHAW